MDKKPRNKKKIENKILMQILSIFIAITLWLIVGYTKDPSIDVNVNSVKVEYTGLSKLEKKGLTVTPSAKMPDLSMVLRGKRSELLQVLGRVKAEVDVSNVNEAGTYTAEISVKIPIASVQILKQKMTTVDINVEPIITKDVPIKIKQDGADKTKDILIKSTPIKNNVQVVGAKSIVDTIEYALAAVDISDMKSDNTQKYKYTLVDHELSTIDLLTGVSASDVDLFIKNEVYTQRIMGIDIIVPEQLKERYMITVKNPINPTIPVGIRTEPTVSKLTAVFSEMDYTAGTHEYTLEVHSEAGIYIPEEEKQIKVKAEIAPKVSQTVSIPVQVLNTPEGYTAELDRTVVEVQAQGILSELTPDKMTASVDLAGITPGIHDIRIVFTVPDSVTIKEEYKVKVSVQ